MFKSIWDPKHHWRSKTRQLGTWDSYTTANIDFVAKKQLISKKIEIRLYNSIADLSRPDFGALVNFYQIYLGAGRKIRIKFRAEKMERRLKVFKPVIWEEILEYVDSIHLTDTLTNFKSYRSLQNTQKSDNNSFPCHFYSNN